MSALYYAKAPGNRTKAGSISLIARPNWPPVTTSNGLGLLELPQLKVLL
jgi:hypothetical protein